MSDIQMTSWLETFSDPQLTPAQRELQIRARDFADRVLRPRAARWDETAEFPEECYQAMIDEGFVGLTMPPEFGGGGLGVFEGCLVLEEMARSCVASAMALQLNLHGPGLAIARLGSPDQRARYLPGVADGSRYFSIAMTEPQAGSDGLALNTTLSPNGDGWLLSGNKCYITGAHRATDYLVFCRLEGTQGSKGIGAVVVHRGADGFDEPVGEPKMGGRGVGEANLHFEGVAISAEDVLISPEANSRNGAEILVSQFNPERCGNAAMCVGCARGAVEDSIEFLTDRHQFGRPLVEFQGLRWKLVDMTIELEASRMFLRRAAASRDQDGFPQTHLTLMAKLHANEMVQRVTNAAIQLHGHRGYSMALPIERYFRDGRGLAIGGGTTEILRNMIADDITRHPVSQRFG